MLKKSIFTGLAFLGLSLNLFAENTINDAEASKEEPKTSSSLRYAKLGTVFYFQLLLE